MSDETRRCIMKKTLYSLVLNDDVVREVDIMAHKMGTNRSSLINRILAEYVNYVTPEQRIGEVLSAIERLTASSRELVPFFSPNSLSMSLKSSLEYKYRPTVKYEVELDAESGRKIGTLSVVFRTQSEYLVRRITSFFRPWKRIEDAYLRPLTGLENDYALYDGKFERTILAPDKDFSAETLAKALSDYIELFDELLKGYLSERLTERDVEASYAKYLENAALYF